MENDRDEARIAPVADEKRTFWSRAVFFCLLAIPVLATAAYGAVDRPALGLLALAAAAIAILWVADAMTLGEFRYSRSTLQLPLLALALIGLIQLLPFGGGSVPDGLLNIAPSQTLSMDPYATRFFVIRLGIYLIFFAAALTFISSKKRLRTAVVTLIVFGTLMGFFAILQRLAAPDAIYGLRPTPQAIPFGSFVNQHHFAAFMVMAAGPALALAIGGGIKRDYRLLLWPAVVMMTVAVFFTGSRGGALSFFGMAAFVLIATFTMPSAASGDEEPNRGEGGKLAALAGLAAFVLLTAGLIFYLGAGDGLLRGIGSGETGEDPTSGRSHFWKIAIEIFLEHPLLGAGLDAFGVAFTRFDTRSGLYRVEQAHNDYLQILADAGVLGFAAVAAFIFLLFRRGFGVLGKRTRFSGLFFRTASVGSLASCFGVLIHSFFDFPLRTTSNGFIFLLLVVIATTSAADAPSKNSVNSEADS